MINTKRTFAGRLGRGRKIAAAITLSVFALLPALSWAQDRPTPTPTATIQPTPPPTTTATPAKSTIPYGNPKYSFLGGYHTLVGARGVRVGQIWRLLVWLIEHFSSATGIFP